MGRTGSGKSTLLRAINGLVPHFSGGTLAGRVIVDGRDTATHRPRDLADVVGFVGQDPLAGFVTDNVEDELAYGMESLGLPPAVMRKRVEETLDLLGLADLRDRPLAQLSGGQQQRVAIGSVLTTHPRVLVLDEPTSALDPLAAEDVLATLQRLVHDLGLTVVLAEHRLERVVQYVDRIVHVPGRRRCRSSRGDPPTSSPTTPIAPPVVELGRAAGWSPLPLTVRDARRRSVDLRARLARRTTSGAPRAHRSATRSPSPRDLVAGYPRQPVLKGITLERARGRGGRADGPQRLRQVHAAAHPGRPAQAAPRAGSTRRRRRRWCRRCPPTCCTPPPSAAECATADRDAARLGRHHPRAARPALPRHRRRPPPARPVRGPEADPRAGDRAGRARRGCCCSTSRPAGSTTSPSAGWSQILRELAGSGHARRARHPRRRAGRRGGHPGAWCSPTARSSPTAPAPDVVVSSPAFAPQVAKVMAPQPWLTAADVAAALGGSPRMSDVTRDPLPHRRHAGAGAGQSWSRWAPSAGRSCFDPAGGSEALVARHRRALDLRADAAAAGRDRARRAERRRHRRQGDRAARHARLGRRRPAGALAGRRRPRAERSR